MSDIKVPLVDEDDKIVGWMEKETAHRSTADHPFGHLHRAFSVFIFSPDRQRVLLQQRSMSKKTFPSAWTNAVCSHPAENEIYGWSGIARAAQRRVYEELGVDIPAHQFQPFMRFIYQAKSDGSKYCEWEMDYVVWTCTNEDKVDEKQLNAHEVSAIKWVKTTEFSQLALADPKAFSPWTVKLIQSGFYERICDGLIEEIVNL